MTLPLSLSVRDLFAAIFSATPPALIDIRVPDDIAADPGRFPAAWRLDYRDRDGIAAAVSSGSWAVILCHGGLKLSQGVAARLRHGGMPAASLEGGVLAWREAGLPLWPAEDGAPVRVASWERTAPDAVLRWLATRLLPRPMELLQVAPDQVADAADRFAGEALPEAQALLARLDRPVPALAAALEAAGSALFARLARGHGLSGDPDPWLFHDLDALVRAAETAA